jgi:nucleotide-binding universal stress UspA family protein
VRFGHAAAETQQDFGGPRAEEPGRGYPNPLLLLLAAPLVLALLLWRRRRTPGLPAARRAIERAVAHAHKTRKPLSLVRIADSSRQTGAGKLARAIRGHVRRGDQLYRLGPAELLLVAPETFADAARLVCSDFQLPLSKVAGPGRIDIRVVEAGRRSADDLLKRLQEPSAAPLDEYELDPLMTSSADGARH